MDRVLLAFDDLQYSGHLEMTLRKVGFDTETITNEYNLGEKLLTFNPDYIIVKGNSSRVSSLSLGKKLRDSLKYHGKVILIFPVDGKPKPEDLSMMRMDLLLYEPISALRLVAYLLTISTADHDAIMDKLLRIAHTDPQFRQNEQEIIKNTGESIDAEIQFILQKLKVKSDQTDSEDLDEDSIRSFVDPSYFKEETEKAERALDAVQIEGSSLEEDSESDLTDDVTSRNRKSSPDLDSKFIEDRDPAYPDQLKQQLKTQEEDLPLRIEIYNRTINGVDQDLKKGLVKRHTKIAAKDTAKLSDDIEKKDRDEERQSFVKALWKKD